jgi:hypothetical protein
MCVAAVLSAAPALAEEARALPEWLTLSLEARIRYETLDGQFRAGGAGGDQILSLRTLLAAEADAGPVVFGVELQDSRSYLADAGTPLGVTFTNPLDVLQAYVRMDAPKLPGARQSDLTVGRFILNYGSRRIVERTDYANVQGGFTGAYWRTLWPAGHELHAHYSSPVARFPNDRPSIKDNRLSGDQSEYAKRFWGLHYRRAGAVAGGWAEVFVYGQHEEDAPGEPSFNRDIVWPGFRLFRDGAPGAWEWDLEVTHRTGTRRATLSDADVTDLDVSATGVHASFGYMLKGPSRLRVKAEIDYFTGDAEPLDDAFEQYERPFGNRRTDLGVTGIYGPFTPSNLVAPGARVEGVAGPRWDYRLIYKAMMLAEKTDLWPAARLRDPSGASGDFLGHQLEGRARYWVVPRRLRLEPGFAVLWKGRFAREAPGAPKTGDTVYGWLQLTATL